MIIRSDHYTDIPVDPATRKRKRTLKNWSNYQLPDQSWHETQLDIRRATIDDTFEDLQLEWLADKQPLQFFVGDAASAGGRPWWGVRRSKDLDTGIVMFLDQGDASAGYTVNGAEKSITYEDVLPDTDLILYAGLARIEKWLALLTATAGQGGTGDRADLGFYLPPNWTLSVVNSGTPANRIEIKRPNGAVYYTSRPAYAVDANEDSVPCTFLDRGTGTLGGRLFYRVRVRCAPTGFTYPILMDPSVTVSGTTDIEDNTIFEIASAIDKNFGGWANHQIGEKAPPVSNDERRGLFRINESTIPAGNIDAFRMHFTRTANAFSKNAANLQAFRILPANDWVEGTAVSVIQAGSSSWNSAKHGSQAWAGAAGCYTSGIDYAADASPPSVAYTAYTAGGDYAVQFDLDTDWAVAWRDGDYSNEGFVVETDDHVVGENQVAMYSSEGGTPLYFEIEYSEPPTGLANPVHQPVASPFPLDIFRPNPFPSWRKK